MLNDPGFHSTAAIVAEVEDTSSWPKDDKEKGRYALEPRYTLQFANCDRSIAFDLEFESEESRINDLKKVDTMISALREFKRGLVIEQRRYAARQKRLKDK